MERNYDLEKLAWEVTNYANQGDIQMAATVLGVELGLKFMEGQESARAGL